jgi:hypothetical protein
MIPYIDAQLSIWGKWSMARSAKGLGFPSICPMFKDARHGGAFGSNPPMGVSLDSMDQILDTDKAVSRLNDEYRCLAIEFYAHQRSGVDLAKSLGLSRKSLYQRLDNLHVSMLGLLNDVVAGC